MKTIRAIILATFLCLSSFTCNAQWGWLIEELIGQVVDEVAGEMGASDANAALEKSINSHSKGIKASLSGYYKTLNTLLEDSRRNASGVLSKSGLGNQSAYLNDIDYVYKGLFPAPAVSDGLMRAFSSNMKNVSGISASTAAPDNLTVEDMLGESTYGTWTNRNRENEKKLREDIYEDLDLIAFFRSVPEALRTYSMVYDSDMRLSKDFLMYSSRVSGKMSSAWRKIWSGYSWGDGNDLFYQISTSQNSIDIMRGGNVVARIENKEDLGYHLACSEFSHDMLNLYPFANSIYTMGECTWKTDQEGRVVSATVTLKHPSAKVKRNVTKGTELSYLKDNYSTLGFATKLNAGSTDQELYLIPIGMGGGEDLINAVPVNTEILKSIELKELDKEVAKYSKKGFPVTRNVTVVYGDKSNLRPTEVTITQTVGDQTPKTITLKNK